MLKLCIAPLVAITLLLLSACGSPDTASSQDMPAAPATSPASQPHAQPRAKPANQLEVVFTYGSEKKHWVSELTKEWNAAGHKTASGKTIHIKAIAMGSGETVREVIDDKRQTHIISPASGAFITLANAEWRAKTGKDLVQRPQQLVLSPVVIAMWRPMAEALGWPDKALGWADIISAAKDDRGWAAHGYPQWGTFKFGHTHPDYSNSGLISLVAEVYAGAGKQAGLTLEDLQNPEVARFLAEIESAVVHYGRSTGFFGRRMMAGGPGYLSAAVLYENMVIESYDPKHQLQFPIVAIYPKEGTFWSDHPAAVVERDYVTAEHREAAGKYLDWLLEEPQQRRAMTHGFRPALVDIPVAEPFAPEWGVDAKQPATTLEVPSAEVLAGIRELWYQNKKKADIVLAIDVSGSMSRESRIQNARKGAEALLNQLSPGDTFTLLPFNNRVLWGQKQVAVADHKDALAKQVQNLYADGGTALYDAISEGHRFLSTDRRPNTIAAVVVLSDGADRNSSLLLPQLLTHIKADNEQRNIRVFTIGYGAGAQGDILKRIAEESRAKFYQGSTSDIEQIFRDIATFF